MRASLLSKYYDEVHATMLCYQSHTLGLFPRGKTQHARVRDNVYCAATLWCLSMAYRHVGYDRGRTYELEQSAVKCMRGLLFCYMRQAEKVEKFKSTQNWEDALHAKFDYMTGDPVTNDDSWGHLQIDGTSLFLQILAQMTATGVQVVFTLDEVDFVQNLVYYVERAYRIPDFGMWERGSRDNIGKRELHSSSIGMAKAALEAMNGLNLFGESGSSLSVIHVDPDAQYRNCVILNTLLPKESNSKEVDAALLLITGYPAFAIDDVNLSKTTEQRVKKLLEGQSGFKRFTRDGHYTIKEDKRKTFYDSHEVAQFEGIECEYPLFYGYLVLTELCRGHRDKAESYWKKLEACTVEMNGYTTIPRLYYVPEEELVADETGTLVSMATSRDYNYKLVPFSETVPFLWAQAIYLIARMLKDNLIDVSDCDPLGLHLPHTARHRGMARHLGFRAPGHDTVIQVALISETTRLQAVLATHGIPTQTQKQVEPIKIRSPADILMKVFSHIGENRKLGLSGRPNRPIGALATSKVYRVFGHTMIFYPTDSMVDFYLSFDGTFLIDVLKTTLQFLNLYWNMNSRPTLCLFLTESRLKGPGFYSFVNFLSLLKQGEVNGIRVRLDRLQALISTSCVENLECSQLDNSLEQKLLSPLRPRSSTARLSVVAATGVEDGTDDVFFLNEDNASALGEEEVKEKEPTFSPADIRDYSVRELQSALQKEENLLGQAYLLYELMKKGEQFVRGVPIKEKLEDIYAVAGMHKHWMTLRHVSSILSKVVDCLAPSVTNMLSRGKEVTIGVFGYPEHIISEPLSPKELEEIIFKNCMPYDPVEAVLQQETIIFLGDFISSDYHNAVFDGMLRLRIGWIIQAMKNELSKMQQDQALYELAPHEVKELVIQVLKDEDDNRTPLNKRQLEGALNRVPPDFYSKVYTILDKAQGGITVRGKTIPKLPTVQELSATEKNFAICVEEFLSNITMPEYRQMVVEMLMVISTIFERNPELRFGDCLNLDDLIQDAFTLRHQDEVQQGEEVKTSKEQNDKPIVSDTNYVCHKTNSFYNLQPEGPRGSTSYMAKAAVNRLLKEGVHYDSRTCTVS
ncbi:hypothetical protein EMCRGX_G031920 [Ephydatia muelleri]